MSSGIGTPEALTFSLSLRYSYATPHWDITSYRSPDSGCFALISEADPGLMERGRCKNIYILHLPHSVLFYSILFCSVLFHSIPFRSISFCPVSFYSIPFYSILFHSILFYSILYFMFPCILEHSLLLYIYT